MRPAHGWDAQILLVHGFPARVSSDSEVRAVEDTPTRVIAVVLSETEWQALRALEREPVGWLRQTIRERLERKNHSGSIDSIADSERLAS
jgi:hypothetical protein